MAALLADAGWLLDRVLPDEDRLLFVRAEPVALRRASFLDGREAHATGAPVAVPLVAALGERVEAPPPDRTIFHVSFCGSTLLSRLVERPGATLGLREPRCFIDLANWHAAQAQAGVADPRFAPTLRLALALARRRPVSGEAVVLKQSSWVNSLLPHLALDEATTRPLFLTIQRADFVRACFRGGSDRLAFTARLAAHLIAAAAPEFDSQLRAAISGDGDQLTKLGRLSALAHAVQEALFARAMAAGGWGSERLMLLGEIEADAHAAAVRAAALLDLEPPDPAGAPRETRRHAKQPELDYDPAGRSRIDRDVTARHRESIESALAWAAGAIATEPSRC